MVAPSKRIQALIIIVVAFFAAFFLYHSNVKSAVLSLFSKNKPSSSSLVLDQATSTDQSNIDSDGDGLKDWQETLWGTDSHNPDTDGDGTPDGVEVAEGRDPLVKGPNDSLELTRGVASTSLDAFAGSASEDQGNISTQLSQTLFSQFMSVQTNGTLDADSEAQIISNTLASVNPGTIPPKYTISDIKVVPENKTTLRAYGNAFAQILSDNNDLISGEQSNEAAIQSYEIMINALSKLSVPDGLVLNHLKILNDFNVSDQSLQIMVNDQTTDPVKALLAVKTLQTNQADMKQLFTNIQVEMQNNGIIFAKSEIGAIWNNS